MPALMATISATNKDFIRALEECKVEAAKVAAKVQEEAKKQTSGFHGWNGVIREGLVLLREIGRGNWTRVPGSFSLFVQQLNNKIPFLKALLNPLTAAFVVLGAVSIGVLVKLVENFRKAQEETKILNNIVGGASTTFEYMADAIDKSVEKLQKLNEFLLHIRDSHETLASQTDERLKQMREEFEWQQKIADAKGQTRMALR